MENDQFIDQNENVSDAALGKVATLGVDFVVLANEVKQLENKLELRKKQLKHLSEVELPETMLQLNMRGFQLANGYKIEIKPVVLVTLPKENVDIAEEWLDSNGHSGMMKHHLDVYLPKGTQPDDIAKLKRSIERFGFDCNDNKSIHYQTLAKWGREMSEEGEEIPETIFKVFRGYKTEITG